MMLGDLYNIDDRQPFRSQYGPVSNTYDQPAAPTQLSPTPQQPTPQQAPSQNRQSVIDQLKQLVGNDYSQSHLQQILQQLNALGIRVQNQDRGDPRPRFLLPDKTTLDFGPGGWMDRGDFGDWDAAYGAGGGGGGGPVGSQAGGTLSDLANTPGYQFAKQQMELGINRRAAAQGTLLTGGTLKQLALGGASLADQTYQQQFQDALNRAKLGMPSVPQ